MTSRSPSPAEWQSVNSGGGLSSPWTVRRALMSAESGLDVGAGALGRPRVEFSGSTDSLPAIMGGGDTPMTIRSAMASPGSALLRRQHRVEIRTPEK